MKYQQQFIHCLCWKQSSLAMMCILTNERCKKLCMSIVDSCSGSHSFVVNECWVQYSLKTQAHSCTTMPLVSHAMWPKHVTEIFKASHFYLVRGWFIEHSTQCIQYKNKRRPEKSIKYWQLHKAFYEIAKLMWESVETTLLVVFSWLVLEGASAILLIEGRLLKPRSVHGNINRP